VDIAKKAGRAGLNDHLRAQIQAFAKTHREGKIVRTWSLVTGSSLPSVRLHAILKFMKKLDDDLRSTK
jgi:hypothetical protein